MENTTTPLKRTVSSHDPIVAYADDPTTGKMGVDEAETDMMHEVESPYVHQHVRAHQVLPRSRMLTRNR